MSPEYQSVAAGIKIHYDTWFRRNRSTHEYTESRLIRATAIQIADECSRKDPAFPYEEFLLACGVTAG